MKRLVLCFGLRCDPSAAIVSPLERNSHPAQNTDQVTAERSRLNTTGLTMKPSCGYKKMKVNCDGFKDKFKDACVSIEVMLHCPGTATQLRSQRHVASCV